MTIYDTLAAPDAELTGEAFWLNVDKGPDCWLWTGSVRNGYGRFIFKRKQYTAHRVAYEWAIGPIPHGRVLDHLCRTLLCVRPSHLEPVTVRENTLRGDGPPAKNAAKTHCPQGHPYGGENLYVSAQGHRGCRACHRDTQARHRANRTYDKHTGRYV